MHASEKRLNEMNRLTDMLHFPALVNAGATANVMISVLATWWVQPRYPGLLLGWITLVLCVNLLPVVLLRLTLTPHTIYPPLGQMNFVHDQHKFSDWVYLAASANMAFWLVFAWKLSASRHSSGNLRIVEILAFLITLFPVIVRRQLSGDIPR